MQANSTYKIIESTNILIAFRKYLDGLLCIKMKQFLNE